MTTIKVTEAEINEMMRRPFQIGSDQNDNTVTSFVESRGLLRPYLRHDRGPHWHREPRQVVLDYFGCIRMPASRRIDSAFM
jgi:hypothetical protein